MSAPNWLDRTIGWMAPERGMRRARARLAMQAMSQLAYEGARKGRRTEGWITTTSDADAESQPVVYDLRNRARDLVRNNPHAASAIDVKVTYTIGTGIMGECSHKGLAKRWEAFTENCDYDGREDFYGLQALGERCRFESGEVLILFVDVERSRDEIRMGLPGFALRVLEPDYLDSARDGRSPEREGHLIRHGIEYDTRGQVFGYWLFDAHPGTGAATFGRIFASGLKSSFVPAARVMHLYRQLRPGQTRGVTEFAPVMLRMRDLDDYDDALLMRKKIEAILAAFVTSPEGAGFSLGSTTTTSTEGRVDTLYPGLVHYLKPGESITFTEPKGGDGDGEFQRFGLRAIFSALGIPYQLASGDLSDVNYSSSRNGLMLFRRRTERDQWSMWIPRFCVPVAERFQAESVVAMGLRSPRADWSWTPPRTELLDPSKENPADIAAIQGGLALWEEVVRERGWNAETQLQKIAEWQNKLKELGVVITSDANHNAGPSAQRFEPPDTSTNDDEPTEPEGDDVEDEEEEAA